MLEAEDDDFGGADDELALVAGELGVDREPDDPKDETECDDIEDKGVTVTRETPETGPIVADDADELDEG